MNIEMLKEWLNPAYLDTNTIPKMQEAFKESPLKSIRLNHFLNDRSYVKTEISVHKAKAKHAKIADRFSYSDVVIPKQVATFFTSKEFLRLISVITGKKLKRCELSIKKFGHRDYTLLHDSEALKPGLEFFFDINPVWNPAWGGSLVYRDAQEELFRLHPTANALTIVNRKKGMFRFLEYVNVKSGQNVRIVVQGLLS